MREEYPHVTILTNADQTMLINLEPSLVHFCQETMRHEYNEFIERDLKEFKTNIISNETSSWKSEMVPYKIQLSLFRS